MVWKKVELVCASLVILFCTEHMCTAIMYSKFKSLDFLINHFFARNSKKKKNRMSDWFVFTPNQQQTSSLTVGPLWYVAGFYQLSPLIYKRHPFLKGLLSCQAEMFEVDRQWNSIQCLIDIDSAKMYWRPLKRSSPELLGQFQPNLKIWKIKTNKINLKY